MARFASAASVCLDICFSTMATLSQRKQTLIETAETLRWVKMPLFQENPHFAGHINSLNETFGGAWANGTSYLLTWTDTAELECCGKRMWTQKWAEIADLMLQTERDVTWIMEAWTGNVQWQRKCCVPTDFAWTPEGLRLAFGYGFVLCSEMQVAREVLSVSLERAGFSLSMVPLLLDFVNPCLMRGLKHRVALENLGRASSPEFRVKFSL
jgi:hypothetical protein